MTAAEEHPVSLDLARVGARMASRAEALNGVVRHLLEDLDNITLEVGLREHTRDDIVKQILSVANRESFERVDRETYALANPWLAVAHLHDVAEDVQTFIAAVQEAHNHMYLVHVLTPAVREAYRNRARELNE
jgi:hypothetical protein